MMESSHDIKSFNLVPVDLGCEGSEASERSEGSRRRRS